MIAILIFFSITFILLSVIAGAVVKTIKDNKPEKVKTIDILNSTTYTYSKERNEALDQVERYLKKKSHKLPEYFTTKDIVEALDGMIEYSDHHPLRATICTRIRKLRKKATEGWYSSHHETFKDHIDWKNKSREKYKKYTKQPPLYTASDATDKIVKEIDSIIDEIEEKATKDIQSNYPGMYKGKRYYRDHYRNAYIDVDTGYALHDIDAQDLPKEAIVPRPHPLPWEEANVTETYNVSKNEYTYGKEKPSYYHGQDYGGTGDDLLQYHQEMSAIEAAKKAQQAAALASEQARIRKQIKFIEKKRYDERRKLGRQDVDLEFD